MTAIRNDLIAAGLKITPQRLAVLEALQALRNHPTAENITAHIRSQHPNIAVGTVYKALETFVAAGMVRKVYTASDTTRYDAVKGVHHHLYNIDNDEIDDYFDENLNNLLTDYFAKKNIHGFVVENFQLHLSGHRI